MIGLVCVGAGSGRRFGGDKLAEDLGGAPVAEVTLAALRRALPDAPLTFVVAPDRVGIWRQRLARRWPDVRVVSGGPRRQDSVRNGVQELTRLGVEIVAIHDAARPLVDSQDVRRTVAAVRPETPGAVLVARVNDTVKRVDGAGTAVLETVDRDRLRLALTPQVFRCEALERAWLEAGDADVTDDAMLLEACGMPVAIVEARRPNPKITVPLDLEVARLHLQTLARHRGSHAEPS